MIKITGGKYKGKKIKTINKIVRPTSSIKREAFFSIIESYAIKNSINFFNDKIFLDLFAGVGTMGLEAISRGIGHAIFYENNLDVIKVLENNCKELCQNKQYTVIKNDIRNFKIETKFSDISIIYIDPPYNRFDIGNLLSNLQNKINQETIIGIESSINDEFEIPQQLELITKKKYGKANLSFLVLA